VTHGEKTMCLRNKDRIFDLMQKGQLKEDKLNPEIPNYLNYWNSDKFTDPYREILQVKIKHYSTV
jgi:hypothetical protein